MPVLASVFLGVAGFFFAYHAHHVGDDKKAWEAIKAARPEIHGVKLTRKEFDCYSAEVGACR